MILLFFCQMFSELGEIWRKQREVPSSCLHNRSQHQVRHTTISNTDLVRDGPAFSKVLQEVFTLSGSSSVKTFPENCVTNTWIYSNTYFLVLTITNQFVATKARSYYTPQALSHTPPHPHPRSLNWMPVAL